MAPVIASSGQTRSRLPPKWMQPHRTTPKTLAADSKPLDATAPAAVTRDSPVRWSTNTLAFDPNDTVRSRAESTTSTYVDTFAHRRKSRISDLSCIDHADAADLAQLTPSDSLTSSINDLSLTLNDDNYSIPPIANLHDDKYASNHETDQARLSDNARGSIVDGEFEAHFYENDEDNDDEDDHLTDRIDRLMAATMEALEASNRLVLDTLASRAKLAQLNAIEAALDSQLDSREAHLRRQIIAVSDMSDFMARTSAELQKLTGLGQAARPPSVDLSSATSQLAALVEPAELQVRGAAATGIVQAQDRDATIGKTAAKRLERMLHAPTTPNASPSSAASNPSRRAFSISNFASVQSSIAEESSSGHEEHVSQQSNSSSTTPKTAADSASESRSATPQKKRSVSYDSRASASIKLMSRLGGPSRSASAAGSALTAAPVTAPSIASGASAASSSAPVLAVGRTTSDTPDLSKPAAARASSATAQPVKRPSLMAALRQEPVLASKSAKPDPSSTKEIEAIAGLPSYSRASGLKTESDSGSASKSAESTLAALLGMSTAPASASVSSRNETPSDSSYFDSATEGSVLSASPPTPGSMHAIRGVLATPWKPSTRDDAREGGITSADPSNAKQRRFSGQYSTLVSPRASLSLSDRERAGQLSSQLAELRAERVTWNSQSLGTAEVGVAGTPTASSSAGGGGALRALQKLNEMSAAKIAGHSGATPDEEGSAWYAGGKRVSLGLGLPSFSGLRPSASRSTSTAGPAEATTSPSPNPAKSSAAVAEVRKRSNESGSASRTRVESPAPSPSEGADADAANTSSSSLLGWRSWTSWNAASPNMSSEVATPQRWSGRTTEL